MLYSHSTAYSHELRAVKKHDFLYNTLHDFFSPLTRDLKIRPLLRRATEIVDILEEIAAAGHDELITAFLGVAARVKLY